jgi:hypothetical protein
MKELLQMLRNLSLALCMLVLLSAYGYTQNRVAQETDPSKLHVFYTPVSGPNYYNLIETTGTGSLIGMVNNTGIQITTEGLTVSTFDESYFVGSWAWDWNWGHANVSGIPHNGGIQWSIESNEGWGPIWCLEQYLSNGLYYPKYWGWDNDWENDGQVFTVAQYYPYGSNGALCRYSGSFDNNMKYAAVNGLQDTVQATVTTPFLGRADVAADVKIWGDSVYNTRGYLSATGVWKIRKNFVQDEGQELFIDGSNYGEFVGQYFFGLTFDLNNHIYVSCTDNKIYQFDMTTKAITKVFDPGAGSHDIMVAGNLLFAGTGSGIKVFDITTAGSPVTTFVNQWEDGISINTLDVIKDPATWGPSTEDFVCNVTLVDWNGASLPTVTVTVDAGTPEVKTLTGSGSSGSFTLSLSPGSHTIKVKAAKSLSQTQTGSTPQAFMLQCGDTNDDNKIDDLDFLSVIGNFGSTDPVLKLIGDGNGDDKTDDLDFLNVIGKFGTSGT